LRLSDFRNFVNASLDLDGSPVALAGENGAGKTNLLEAVSLLAPGRGLRGAPFAELARLGGSGLWAVSSRLVHDDGETAIGTGLELPAGAAAVSTFSASASTAAPVPAPALEEIKGAASTSPSASLPAGSAGRGAGRIVKIDGRIVKGPGRMGELLDIVWLTPAMDRLFNGPASERRRFLDRLIAQLDPSFRPLARNYERAMRQRNRLLETGSHDEGQFRALERAMAETGAALAAARLDAVERLGAAILSRWPPGADNPFPWSRLQMEGRLEDDLRAMPSSEAEDRFLARLRAGRERDRAARRALEGPHRSDFSALHGPRDMPARLCSTGERKALLVGLILAHAGLLAARRGAPPLILLDEICAHLDQRRREALFGEIKSLLSQAFMTGTESSVFSPLKGSAQFFFVREGAIMTR
jgi:DNA replication and repair protein RecF